MQPTVITATTLADAWFQLVYNLMSGEAPHSVYTIDRGSYVGSQRLEYDFILATIQHPGQRPLIPDIPAGLGIPAPVESMEYVEQYFTRYLMDPELEPNETYKYASWLAPGVERIIKQLKGAPGNNQATISIGGWVPFGGNGLSIGVFTVNGKQAVGCLDTDNFIDPGTGQRDPACLRVVDFRLDQTNTLHMVVYFRSWDLWNGFPANLAGLQLVKEYVGQEIGAQDGTIVATSKGLHIYSHAIQVAATRVGLDSVGSMDDLVQYLKTVVKP
jgi:thymidylate synthase